MVFLTGQLDPEYRFHARRTYQFNVALMGFGDVLDNGQANPQSFPRPSAIHAVKTLEDVRLMHGRNASPPVLHRQIHKLVVRRQLDANISSILAVPDRIIEEIPQRSSHKGGIDCLDGE